MKVSILTHQLATNYGGLLQNYALQVVLLELGHTPVTLDYYIRTPTKVKLLSFLNRLYGRIKGDKKPLRGWTTSKEQAYIAQNTNRFINNYISKTDKFELQDSRSLIKNLAEAIIVGSDQVWRGNHKEVHHFFLSDIKNINIPKIAYAASFGVDFWEYNKKQTRLCYHLIRQFRAISVREESGVELCKKYLNCDATFVLDPTLLIDKKYYEKLVNSKCFSEDKDYMMVYILDSSQEKNRIIQEMLSKLGLCQHIVMANKYFKEVGHSGIDQCVFPSVERWISGFMNAKFVITDSFHGTAFSIIFKKNFICIANKGRGIGRFTSLLKLLNLENRLVETVEDISAPLINSNINYEAVEQILIKKRQESISFLINNLK